MDWRFNKFEKLVIVFAIAMIISLGVSGCATKQVLDSTAPTEVPTIKQPTRAETIGKMPVIVDALGCVFAPQTCGGNTDK
jgi:hypothetical protein